MESGLRLWQQLFGKTREVDYEYFEEKMHFFVKKYGEYDLDGH